MSESHTQDRTAVNTNVGNEVLFENDRVRVWRARLEPGEQLDPHVHFYDHVFVYANPSRMRAYLSDQEESVPTPPDEGFVYYREVGEEGLPEHWLVNEGDTTSVHYIVELLEPSRSETAQPPQHNNRFLPGLPTGW